MDTHRSNIDACVMALNITADPVADQILSEDPFALLAGMMLDQQFPMERAFAGPAKIKERFGTLDPVSIAAAPPCGHSVAHCCASELRSQTAALQNRCGAALSHRATPLPRWRLAAGIGVR